MSVVRATAHDRARVEHLFGEYFEAIALPLELRDSAATIHDYLRPPSGVWLADGDAGTIALRPLAAPAGACEVKRLYVRPAARGRGLADALLDALEAGAREAGFLHIYLDTRADMVAALRFYLRRGYEPCERYNDNPVAAHYLRRELR